MHTPSSLPAVAIDATAHVTDADLGALTRWLDTHGWPCAGDETAASPDLRGALLVARRTTPVPEEALLFVARCWLASPGTRRRFVDEVARRGDFDAAVRRALRQDDTVVRDLSPRHLHRIESVAGRALDPLTGEDLEACVLRVHYTVSSGLPARRFAEHVEFLMDLDLDRLAAFVARSPRPRPCAALALANLAYLEGRPVPAIQAVRRGLAAIAPDGASVRRERPLRGLLDNAGAVLAA